MIISMIMWLILSAGVKYVLKYNYDDQIGVQQVIIPLMVVFAIFECAIYMAFLTKFF